MYKPTNMSMLPSIRRPLWCRACENNIRILSPYPSSIHILLVTATSRILPSSSIHILLVTATSRILPFLTLKISCLLSLLRMIITFDISLSFIHSHYACDCYFSHYCVSSIHILLVTATSRTLLPFLILKISCLLSLLRMIIMFDIIFLSIHTLLVNV